MPRAITLKIAFDDQAVSAFYEDVDYAVLQQIYGRDQKPENLEAAVALNYLAYNFISIHRTLTTSPAMAAGVTSKLWEVSDLVALLEPPQLKKRLRR